MQLIQDIRFRIAMLVVAGLIFTAWLLPPGMLYWVLARYSGPFTIGLIAAAGVGWVTLRWRPAIITFAVIVAILLPIVVYF